ncbi:MAG: hypothetical protein KDD52_00155 [Bdellovibrionales bacterium]|nr:hypothetical protein [Bdellovibrionales bacterium]
MIVFFCILQACGKNSKPSSVSSSKKNTSLRIVWITSLEHDPWFDSFQKCFSHQKNIVLVKKKEGSDLYDASMTLIPGKLPSLKVKNSASPEGKMFSMDENPSCETWQYLAGFVLIFSSPPGANVFVDGMQRPSAPSWAFVDKGTHELRCSSKDQSFRQKNFSFPENLRLLCERENTQTTTQEVMDFGSEDQEKKTAWIMYVFLALGAVGSFLLPLFIF